MFAHISAAEQSTLENFILYHLTPVLILAVCTVLNVSAKASWYSL